MVAKIFLSYTQQDKELADVICRILYNSFDGDISIYLAHSEIKAGDFWKDEIRKALSECDAIISIITSNSIEKPWIFIEWSSFWIAEKKYFILKTDDVLITDLVHPMQDSQVTTITNENSVRGLFFRLADLAGKEIIPFHHVDSFVDSVSATLLSQHAEMGQVKLAKYKDVSELFLAPDEDQMDVALFRLMEGDKAAYVRIANNLRDDHNKFVLATKMLEAHDLHLLWQIAEGISAVEYKQNLALLLLDHGYGNATEFYQLIEDVALESQAHLRRIAQVLVEQKKVNTNAFGFILENLRDGDEMRKVAEAWIANGQESSEIFKEMYFYLDARSRAKLCSFVLRIGKQKDPIFQTIYKYCPLDSFEGKKMIDELRRKDIELYNQLENAFNN